MMNRFLMALAALFGSSWLASGEVLAQPATKPNFIIILADDLGFSDIGCYGSEIATPNLDRLANNGLRFTQFYNTARCWPTRAALLTGYYAQQVGRDGLPGVGGGSRGKRPTWAPLLPALLKPLNYRSYHSGKWHIDGPQLPSGFDKSYNIEDHDRHFNPQQHLRDDMKLPPVAANTNYYSSTAIVDHAIACLQDHAQQHANEPFFHYVAFIAPHFPLHAPAADIARYRDCYQTGWENIRAARWKQMQNFGLIRGELAPIEREIGPPYPFPEALKKLGPDEINRPLVWSELNAAQQAFQAAKMAVHAAMVDRMDQEIGRLLKQLETQGALENTVICFLSDNGASAEMMVRGDGHDTTVAPGAAGTFLSLGPGWSSASNTPFRRHKTWVHEGGISTPLVVHWPKGIAAKGELRSTPGHVIDLVPTFLELAGGKPVQTWQGVAVPPAPGRSLVPALAADVPVKRDYLWWLHEGNRALRVGDWKLVAAGKMADWELYNLNGDRTETHNLAAEQPDRVQAMQQQWNDVTATFVKQVTESKAAETKVPQAN